MVSVFFSVGRTANQRLASDEVVALVDVNDTFLSAMTDTVEKYLNMCGRRWVELDGLFSFMKV